MNILWLASWYPNKINFLAGDFIERHAKAASLYDNIVVIHAVKDPSISGGRAQIQKIEYSKSLTAFICYYPAYRKLGRLVENFLSTYFYIRMHFQAYAIYKRLYGKPQGILVQVAIKSGIIAYLWRILFSIHYVVFERWTGLLKQAKPNFEDLNFLYRKLWKLVFTKADKIITVTNDFGKSISPVMPANNYTVIPNVIMDELFFPGSNRDDSIFRIIHVSTLDYQKNFEDILLALHELKLNSKIQMVVYGPSDQRLKQLTSQLGLEKIVEYRGEVTHDKIAQAMQASHVLVLYSRYESFGNVIIEANSCGLPVIVSDLPVFHEIVVDGVTGLFVKGEKPKELAKKISWLIDNYKKFDAETIHNLVRERYNAAVIGSKFRELFHSSFQNIQK